MGLNRRRYFDRECREVMEYIKTHGRKEGDLYIWDRMYICIKDVCVTSVVVDGDELYWADIDRRTGEVTVLKTTDQLAGSASCRRYLKDCFTDIKRRDTHPIRK